MKPVMDAGKIINPESMIAWWRWKLEIRQSVPACAEMPFCVEENTHRNFGWVSVVAHDYLYLSYTGFCEESDYDTLCENEFHIVFLGLFTHRYVPKVTIRKCHGFREYIDDDPVKNDDYIMMSCYRIPSIYLCRALFELATESGPVEWPDGCRMDESYKGSNKFWHELSRNNYYCDNGPQYGDQEFLPKYMTRRSKY